MSLFVSVVPLLFLYKLDLQTLIILVCLAYVDT